MSIDSTNRANPIMQLFDQPNWVNNGVKVSDVLQLYREFHGQGVDDERAAAILDGARVRLREGKALPLSGTVKDVVLQFAAVHGGNHEAVVLEVNDLLISAASGMLFRALHDRRFRNETDKQGRQLLKIQPLSGRLFKYLLYSITKTALPKGEVRFTAAELTALLQDVDLYEMHEVFKGQAAWFAQRVVLQSEEDVKQYVAFLQQVKAHDPQLDIEALLPAPEQLDNDAMLGAYALLLIDSGLLSPQSTMPDRLVQACVTRMLKLSDAIKHQYNFYLNEPTKKSKAPAPLVSLCGYWRAQLPFIRDALQARGLDVRQLTIASGISLPEKTLYWLLTLFGSRLDRLEVSNAAMKDLRPFVHCLRLQTLALKDSPALESLNLPLGFRDSFPVTSLTVVNSPLLSDTSALNSLPHMTTRSFSGCPKLG